MAQAQHRLDFERIRILYSGMPGLMVGMLAMTSFSTIFLYHSLPSTYTWIWCSTALVCLVPRYVVVRLFQNGIKNQSINENNILAWENYWVISGILLSGVFSALSFFPYSSLISMAVATILLTVFMAASIVNTNMSIKAVAVTAFIVILPLIYHLVIQDSVLFMLLAAFYIAVFVVFSNYVRRLNRTLLENINLKLENESISLTDDLTNLWNRRGLHFYIEKLIPRSLRSSEPFTVILLDIDHFKDFNDTHGHNAGDVELVKVATAIEQETRDADLVVRYGGEEFLIVLPAATIEQTREVAERICTNVRNTTGVTVSGGIAVYRQTMSLRDLVGEADEALYAAKAAGRDKFFTAEETRTLNKN